MQTSDENYLRILIIGLLIDPIPNSPYKHTENHLADSKENY